MSRIRIPAVLLAVAVLVGLGVPSPVAIAQVCGLFAVYGLSLLVLAGWMALVGVIVGTVAWLFDRRPP